MEKFIPSFSEFINEGSSSSSSSKQIRKKIGIIDFKFSYPENGTEITLKIISPKASFITDEYYIDSDDLGFEYDDSYPAMYKKLQLDTVKELNKAYNVKNNEINQPYMKNFIKFIDNISGGLFGGETYNGWQWEDTDQSEEEFFIDTAIFVIAKIEIFLEWVKINK